MSQLLQGGDLFIAVGSEPFDIKDFAAGVGSEFVDESVCLSVCLCVFACACEWLYVWYLVISLKHMH